MGRPPPPVHPDHLVLFQLTSLWGLVPGEAVSLTKQKPKHSTVLPRLWITPHLLASRLPDHLLQWQQLLLGPRLGRSRPKSHTASRALSLSSLQQHRAGRELDGHPVNTENPRPLLCRRTLTHRSILAPTTRQHQDRKCKTRKRQRVHLASLSASCTVSRA